MTNRSRSPVIVGVHQITDQSSQPENARGPKALMAAAVRIPTKPAMHSNSKPAGYSDLKSATRGVIRMGLVHDVVEGWEGQETG
ncbi:MAG: hypothetical protein J0H51_17200 [Rhizobiales bacterium]|nr:hypothetical protein [Hyphomicrobiales bacterium]